MKNNLKKHLNTYLFVAFATFLNLQTTQVLAQFGDIKNKLKDKAGKVKDATGVDLEKISKNATVNQMNKGRARYDSTNFSIAIAVSDETGFYEEKDLFRDIGADKIAANMFMNDGKVNATTFVDNDPLQVPKTTNNTGEMAFSSSKYATAEKCFLSALSEYKASGAENSIFYNKTLSNLGLLYTVTARNEEAEKYINFALVQKEKLLGKDSPDYAFSLNNKAILYTHLGQYDEAQQLIDEAISIVEKANSKDKMPLAILQNNKGYIYQTLGRFTQAETTYKKALEIAGDESGEKKPNYQRMMTNLALLYQETNRFDEADKIFQKAIKIKKNRLGTKSPDYAHLLNLAAANFMQMNKLDKVEDYLKDAMKIYEGKFTKVNPAYAKAQSNLGVFYRIKGDLKKSEDNLKEALATRLVVLGDNHPKTLQSKEELAILFWQKNEVVEAAKLYREVLNQQDEFIQKYFPPMSEAEKEKYWTRLRPTYQRFFAFATTFAKQDPQLLVDMYNYHTVTKGILVSSTNRIKKTILASKDAKLIADYNEWIAKKELLSGLYELSKEELLEQKIDIKAIENEANTLEKSLSTKSDAFNKGFKEDFADFAKITNALAPDEAAVEIINFYKFDKQLTDSSYYAALIAVKGNKTPQLVLMTNGKSMETDDFAYYKNAIRSKKDNQFAYKAYWESIEKALAGKKKIYTSLDGVYHQVNMNTLLKPSGKYVIEDQNLVLVTNTRDIPMIKKREKLTKANKTKTAVLIGNPNYGTTGAISPLPGTKKEVEGIKPLLVGYKTVILMGNEASETKFKEIDDKTHPTILHIATHGFFLDDVKETDGKVFGIEATKAKENPLLRAGLMFAGSEAVVGGLADQKALKETENGVLTAYEVMNMNLEDTELTIISACETGNGTVVAGEGVYGLQRAFQVAGTDALVMSLWKVSDEGTQELMRNFYQALVANGGNRSTAFKQAQLKLKEKYKSPYFWGAFVMVGF